MNDFFMGLFSFIVCRVRNHRSFYFKGNKSLQAIPNWLHRAAVHLPQHGMGATDTNSEFKTALRLQLAIEGRDSFSYPRIPTFLPARILAFETEKSDSQRIALGKDGGGERERKETHLFH